MHDRNPENPVPTKADVLVIGGGITGISLASLLAANGKSVVLVEKNDFASGTSQNSGMLIWGGLLYMRNLEFLTVRKFCKARDRLMRNRPGEIEPRRFTYLARKKGGRNPWVMWLALQLYRALSLWERSPVKRFPLARLVPPFDGKRFNLGWTYEEGILKESDSRFAMGHLEATCPNLTALNYHEVTHAARPETGGYSVTTRDLCRGGEIQFQADKIVNCGGVWADEINARHGITTRHAHHLSKGVYLLLEAPHDGETLVLDTGADGDVLCWVPWGEVVMWGPTETTIGNLSEAHANAADVDWLLDHLNRQGSSTWTRDHIVNVRCGVRPLVKTADTRFGHPLDLSRRAVVEKSPDQPWWTVFGGKLSGAADVAAEIYGALYPMERTPAQPSFAKAEAPLIGTWFKGRLLPDPTFCRDHEFCRSLEDYLRRRTNLAQWIPNAGFGRDFEFEGDLRALARIFSGNPLEAEEELQAYREKVILEKNRWMA